MIDSQFDDFAKGRLGDHEVPVPAGLWGKISDGQFDQQISSQLRDASSPVPDGLWDKITDAQFDHHIQGVLSGNTATVSPAVWGNILDAQFDGFVHERLHDVTSAVPTGLWERIMPEENDDKGGVVWFRRGLRIAAMLLLIAGIAAGSYYWLLSRRNDAPEKKNTGHTVSAAADPKSQEPGKDRNSSALPGQDAAGAQSLTGNAEHANISAKEPLPGQASGNAQIPGSGNGSAGRTSVTSSPGNTTSLIPPVGVQRAEHFTDEGAASGRANAASQQTTEQQLAPDFPDTYQFLQFNKGNTIVTARSLAPYVQDKKLGIGNHNSLFKSIIICPTDRGGNTDWYLEAYASPDLAFRSFRNNGASQQYVDRKDSSESLRPGFSAGIRLVKPLNDRILLKAGVQYSQVNQKYVYRTDNEIKNITTVTTRTIIRSPGDTVVIRDTSVVQQIGFKNNTVINRFRTLDIPVTVGYQFGNDDLKIGLNAGLIVNVSSWYQGVMLDSSLATVPIQKGSSNMVYKSNVGLGLYGGVSVVKRISDDLHIFAEPYFRYNLSNMTTPNAAYQQKFSIGGISLGVRLNLNRQ